MSYELLLPKLGFAMTEGEISEWLVPDGSAVAEGQTIFTLESDKSVQEVEAPVSGVLQIMVQPGTVYPVGTVVGTITPD